VAAAICSRSVSVKVRQFQGDLQPFGQANSRSEPQSAIAASDSHLLPNHRAHDLSSQWLITTAFSLTHAAAGVAGQAMQQGSEGFLEDTLAGVQPWGFRPDAIRVPALIMHGAKDKMVLCAHGEWLAARCPAAESHIVPDAGHITMLDSAPEALTWLAARVRA
jgi:pimeloyl-ACP methyl ester carboxylesterase